MAAQTENTKSGGSSTDQHLSNTRLQVNPVKEPVPPVAPTQSKEVITGSVMQLFAA